MQSTNIVLSKQSRRSISISKGDFPISKGTFYAAPLTWIFSYVWILTVLDHHSLENSTHATGHIWTQFKINVSAIGACITKLIFTDKTFSLLPKYYWSLHTHLWTWLVKSWLRFKLSVKSTTISSYLIRFSKRTGLTHCREPMIIRWIQYHPARVAKWRWEHITGRCRFIWRLIRVCTCEHSNYLNIMPHCIIRMY